MPQTPCPAWGSVFGVQWIKQEGPNLPFWALHLTKLLRENAAMF